MRLCPSTSQDTKVLNALVDFCYNLGAGRLQTSTLRRKVNDADWDGARQQLKKWVRGGGRVLPGLVARREAEAALLPT
jgi:lysozyme